MTSSSGSDARLDLESADGGVVSIRHGERRTIGRSADVKLGADDVHVHGVVCSVALDVNWSIEIPVGNTLWVDVLTANSGAATRLWSGEPGSRFASNSDEATILVRTVQASHRVALRAWTPTSRVRQSTNTRLRTFALDVNKANDRAMIVACAERLEGGAKALGEAAIGRQLKISEAAAKQRLTRAVSNVAMWMEMAGEIAPVRDHDPLVDWLVCTGAVTRRMLLEAQVAEAANPRSVGASPC